MLTLAETAAAHGVATNTIKAWGVRHIRRGPGFWLAAGLT